MDLDDLIDLGTLVVILVLFLPMTIVCSKHMISSSFGGFDVQIEKTALSTNGELGDLNKYYTKNDIMLCLAVADKYTPKPASIKVNNTQVNLDSAFFDNRIKSFSIMYNAVKDDNNQKILKTVSNDKGMVYWEFENK